MSRLQGRLDKLRGWIWRIEDGLILLLLLGMIVLACLQIFMRTAFNTGWRWADAMLRVLLLWTALLGAMVATRHDKHISIDVVSKLLERGTYVVLHRPDLRTVAPESGSAEHDMLLDEARHNFSSLR